MSDKPEIQIRDDAVYVLANEFDQVRECLGMYIGVGETEGVMHLANEIMTNCIDEAVNPEVVSAGIGNTIEFYFDEELCRFIIVDNGRGMPLDKMIDLVGKKHAGTKFRNLSSVNRYSGGQNGVGITVTAALSSVFQVTCWRQGKSKTLHMEDSTLIDEGIERCSPNKHGTRVTFVPSNKWIGDFKIELADVEDYLRRLSYILPERVKIKYLGTGNGQEHSIVYKAQGIGANVEYLGTDLAFPPVYIQVPEVVIDYDGVDKEPDYFKMEFAFSYDKSLDTSVCASFCNYISTKDGGYHETAVARCLSDFFVREAKKLDPNHKYEIITDDCKTGLVYVVNCDHSSPNFEGQHKSKVGQRDLPKHARKPIMSQLEEFFNSNNALLRKIVAYLHQIAKARLEINKVKSSAMKRASTFLDDMEMKIFANISDRNYSGYKELIIAEGDSAISAVGSARNVKCQAIFAVTGVVPNTFGMPTSKVVKSRTFETLIKVLGCGIGPDFDIAKLRWDSIIIMCDSDVDGSNITSLLCTFFACHLPEIVLAGRLYKGIPPLYLINTAPLKSIYSGREYLFDKKELYDLYHKLISENMDIAIVSPETLTEAIEGKGKVTILDDKEKIALLDHNIEYYDELDNIVRRSACTMEILEYICYFILICRTNRDPVSGINEDFCNAVTRKFGELHYDQYLESIHGSYHGMNVALIIDKIFFKITRRMFRIMENSPFYLLVKRKDDKRNDDPLKDNWDLMSYGQFMAMCSTAFNVPIIQRYKGLGETETIMVFPSMMNPKTRKLVRITMKDKDRAMEQLRILHGDGADMREARRKMLKDADITIADIDN